jgi:hypothetical protein
MIPCGLLVREGGGSPAVSEPPVEPGPPAGEPTDLVSSPLDEGVRS